MDTFYLDSSFICQSCHTSCATCTTLSACLTCPSATQIINSVTGKCECPPPKSWDTSTSSCIACDYTCTTCSLATTNCTSCDLANFRNKVSTSCPCMLGYYDNNIALCVACDYTCMSCNAAGGTACMTCDSSKNRKLVGGNTCSCKTGYFDDGTHTTCQSCQYSCLTCTSSSTCATCDSLLFR